MKIANLEYDAKSQSYFVFAKVLVAYILDSTLYGLAITQMSFVHQSDSSVGISVKYFTRFDHITRKSLQIQEPFVGILAAEVKMFIQELMRDLISTCPINRNNQTRTSGLSSTRRASEFVINGYREDMCLSSLRVNVENIIWIDFRNWFSFDETFTRLDLYS